jgi:hypothetical protein
MKKEKNVTRREKAVSVLLTLALLLSLAVPAAAAGPAVLTRGAFLEALYARSGDTDALPHQTEFSDVPADGALAQAVRWAVDSGIVSGYGDGRFGPEDPVTREQMAAMLYRNAQALGFGFRGLWKFRLAYDDAAEVSPWADEAVHWAVMNGVLAGTDGGLEPQAPAAADLLDAVLDRWQAAVSGAVDTVLSDVAILHEEEFGGAYLCSTIDAFNALGFSYGDSVRIEFSNGCVLDDLPYYNGYYTQTGEPLLVAYPGYPYIKAGINNGDDLFVTAGLRESDTATVTLVERGRYTAIQNARDIHYTDLREDYQSDTEFANFRSVRAGGIGEGILCRSASPCDNQHGRAPYADALMSGAGVAFILNLSDDEQKLRGYLDDPGFASPGFLALYESGGVVPIALNMNYGSAEFKEKVAGGLSRMAEVPGPYLVHCTEGKDRTGFVCMLLEALCGANYEEIVDDYMITYRNYYGISAAEEPERYEVIVESVLDPMIRSLAGDDGADVRTVDLAGCAAQYLTDGGMAPALIGQLRDRLAGA